MSYWVQLEHTPQGQDTAYALLDLSLVQAVKVTFTGDVLQAVIVCYPPIMPSMLQQICEGIAMTGLLAKEFLKAWDQYLLDTKTPLNYVSDRAVPGLINVTKEIPKGLQLR